MSGKTIFSLAIVLISTFVSILQAAGILYVDVNGPNGYGTGSYDDPFRKIQDAIDNANEGDTIEILPGIYTGPGNYNLDPKGKSITIRSIDPNDSNVVASTIIDPKRVGRGFYFHSGEDANCAISGFTLRNGYTNGSGGAVFCTNSSPAISRCVIIGNTAVWGGGGICCYYSDLSVSNCVIAGNMTNSNGGGVKYFSCNGPKIINSTICSNKANWYGDGIYCYDSSLEITNCIFWSNNLNDVYVCTFQKVKC